MSEPELWTGARVFTGRRFAEAILFDEGGVIAVGSESEVRRAAPTGTTTTSRPGQLVLPGLIDAHLHVGELARMREGLDLAHVRDLDDLLGTVRRWGEAHPEGPVVGRGLDVERSLHGRWPHLEDLDRALTDRAVVLMHVSGHAAVANRVALSTMGIESMSAAETQGRVGRTADGRPNGILYEEALRWLPPPAPGDAAAVVRTLDFLASLGLTTVASMNVGPEELALVRSLATDHRLPIRVRIYVRLLRLDAFSPADLAPVDASGRFSVVGSKGFVDGAFGPRTALLSEPYSDDPDSSGVAVETDASLSEALERSHRWGLAPALHAIGDRGVLRAVSLLTPYVGGSGPPARVEHVGLTPPAVLAALDPAGLALVVQPGFVWSDFWLPRRIGPERARWAYAFRTLLGRGLRLVGSSDAPYDPADPWRGLRAASERRDELGRSANPDPKEALSVEQAIGLYTGNAGAALGEPTLGSLEVGSAADLLVLEAKGLADAVRRGSSALRETWVGGVRSFGHPGADGKAVS